MSWIGPKQIDFSELENTSDSEGPEEFDQYINFKKTKLEKILYLTLRMKELLNILIGADSGRAGDGKAHPPMF